MNNKSFLVSIAMIIMAGCVSEDDALLKTRVPISLTTSIAPTRATQDVQIGDGQEVYIWANEEEVSGTTNWDANNYIEAWHLTANATGGLTSANTYYYPTRPLSMVAIHGNFEFDEGKTQFPGVVSHTILADQSTAANLMKSDLLWWKGSGITSAGNPGGIPVTFAHNLSKIEITLSSDFYTADQLNAMEVSLCNVLPTVDLSLADGTTNAAHGTRITVKPLKPSASSPTFEAVIPAQARPDNFIVVRLDGGVVNVDAQVSEFDANTRYPYNLDITYRDVRKNPLWYVAEYNVNYDGSSTYSWATTPDEGYYFSWSDAMQNFSSSANVIKGASESITDYYPGYGKFIGWHLPVMAELYSIVPGVDNDNSVFSYVNSTNQSAYKADLVTAVWGYNLSTRTGISETSWFKYVADNEIHAIRFLGTEYCSAWKYVWDDSNHRMTIYSTIIPQLSADGNGDAASDFYSNHWSEIYFGNNEPTGSVMRAFGGLGCTNASTGSSATGNTEADRVMLWTSTEESDTQAYFISLYNNTYGNRSFGGKLRGMNVRLFRDNYETHPLDPDNLRYGDVIYDDNTYSRVYEPVNTNGRNAIGVVLYTSADGDQYTEKNIVSKLGYTIAGKALVVALHDANETRDIWGGNADHTGGKVSGYGDYVMFPNVDNTWTSQDYSGYYKTKYLANAVCGHTNHNLAKHAWNYAPSTRTDYLALSSGWFLPSLPQWIMIGKSLATNGDEHGGNTGSTTISGYYLGDGKIRENLLILLGRAGGLESETKQYGTSSESNATYSQHVGIGDEHFVSSANTKLREDRPGGAVGIDYARAFIAY